MPTIRDGRGVLTVHDMGVPPPGSPSGPVERDRVSEQMADFAAERAAAAPERRHLSLAEKAKAAREHIAVSRARGAKAGGFVAGATKPLQIEPTPNAEESDVDATKRDQRRIERRDRILAAIRSTSSYVGAAAAVGLSRGSIEVFVSDLRRRDELPDDVAELLRGRNPSIGKRTAAPAKPTTIQVQAPEAGVPATEADEPGPTATGSAAELATTPPAPLLRAVPTHFVQAGGGPVEGEDRCSFGRPVGNQVLVVCDRLEGHDGTHRGRLISLKVADTATPFTMIGFAAVPA